MPVFLGLTILQWIAMAPRIWAVAKFFVALVVGYSVLNKTNPIETALALSENLTRNIPKPHKMTAAEEEIWFKRSTPDPHSG